VENRITPPLMYNRVFQLKKEFPSLCIEINGGIDSISDSFNLVHDNNLDGCMVGRLALANPF
jgi:tRNA-dihydrouridine synthase A